MRKLTAFIFVLLGWVWSSQPSPAQDPVSQTSPAYFFAAAPENPGQGECISSTPQTPDRLHVDVEYILWWLREGRVPALLTTSSPASAGILGRPDTRVLYGDDRLETRHGDRFNGVRISLDYWLNECETLGIEGSAFFLERDSTHFKAVSDGSTVLARPFVNALDGGQASEVIAGPSGFGDRNGQFVGYSRIELFAEEVNFKTPLLTGDAGRLELLAGAHFLQMRDRTDLTATGHPLSQPSTLLGLTDHFRVEDRFWGGQAGLRGDLACGRWRLRVTGETALGATDATVRAFGDRIFQTPAAKLVIPYGLAVQPSNSGRFEHTEFAAVTQVGVSLGYRVCDRLTVFLGYTFLYWDAPLRAGDQIDLQVNPALITGTPHGPAHPAIPFRSDALWAQGCNLGVELNW
jgi:hypothetical protein